MFQGSIVALVTPMQEKGDIDYVGLKGLLDFHIENETDAIVVLGSTGESVCLEESERQEILTMTVDHVNGRKPIIAGTGTSSTAKTIALSKAAMDAGVDACLVVAPCYNRPPQEGLYRHYASLAEAVPLPLILYNVPSRTAVDILPETVERLCRVANIVGIKDATGKLERLKEMQQRCGNKLSYLSGDDPTALEFILQGGQGVISITSNIAPKQMHDMCKAALEKKGDSAKKMNDLLAELHVLMCIESNPIPVKWALSELKRISSAVRLPLVPLSQQHHERLRDALKVLL